MEKTSSLMVRLDHDSKAIVAAAAGQRKVSVSDYVRTVMVEQARRELVAAQSLTIAMTPDEQLKFWHALSKPTKLTKSQKELALIMRGEA